MLRLGTSKSKVNFDNIMKALFQLWLLVARCKAIKS